MPVRKVVTRSGKRFRGKFPSRKLGRMVGWESLLERDAILVAEHTPEITSFEEQPSKEIYNDADGKARTYIPDLRVEWRDGSVTDVEVKPAKQLQKPELAKKYALVAKRYANQGRAFQIWTEKEIRGNQRFKDVKKLHRARKRARS